MIIIIKLNHTIFIHIIYNILKIKIFLHFLSTNYFQIPSATQVFVTGSSVVAFKYVDTNGKQATALLADLGLSYGSLHIKHDESRIYQLTPETFISFSGDEADFQQNVLDEINILIQDYQFKMQQIPSTKYIFNYISALFFDKRDDQKPIMNSIVIVSHNFIGYIDYLGTHFETDYIATSIGRYYVVPLIRDTISQKDLNREEAIQLADQIMTVLRNSDCLQVRKYDLYLIEENNVQRLQKNTNRVQSFQKLADYQDLIKVI